MRTQAKPPLQWSWGLAYAAQDFCHEMDSMVHRTSVKDKVAFYGVIEGRLEGSVELARKGRGRDNFIL